MSVDLSPNFFPSGQAVSDPEFREKLNLISVLSQTLAGMKVGNGLKFTFEPGVGATLELLETPSTPVRATIESGGDNSFWARVTAITSDSPNRWLYDVTRVVKTAAGYAGWSNATNEDGTPDRYLVLNTLENMNSESGQQGNGINLSNGQDSGFGIQPVPTGAIVRVFPVTLDGEISEWWFAYPNAFDGGCA